MYLTMLFFLIVFFAVVVFVQIVYYLFVFGAFSYTKSSSKNTPNTKKQPVSVIICAKNEAENLTKHLPLILEQDYPVFEIVLINDASYDGTIEIMEAFAEKHKNIKIVDVKEVDTNVNWSSKKYALTLGIKAASYDCLLLTDADCAPSSKNWIAEIAASFSTEKTIVLGYGGYETLPTFLNKLIRFETLLTALQYFSWAKRGNPYMGVGRNLAYKKEHFFGANGFVDHMKILSGDDDLFINGVANYKNTTIVATPESFTRSLPKETYADWIEQKRRHISTAKYYKFKDRVLLGLFYVSQLLFLVLSIALLATTAIMNYQILLYAVLGIIGVRYLISFFSVGFAASKLKEKNLVVWYPVLEFLLIFIQISLFITNLFLKPNRWR